MPSLEAGGARVINVASGGLYAQALHLDDPEYRRGRYDGSKAYARAKRALVALTEYWARQYPDHRVTFNSMHPGWAATPGVAKSLPAFNRKLRRWLRDPRMGADTIVWLASARAPASESGRFWFDRKPVPTAVWPGTDVTPEQQTALIRWLEKVAPAGSGD
jgi:NAD(P)-dependent dehydrogenase (short-subunit alcohol dehydrogenase family)